MASRCCGVTAASRASAARATSAADCPGEVPRRRQDVRGFSTGAEGAPRPIQLIIRSKPPSIIRRLSGSGAGGADGADGDSVEYPGGGGMGFAPVKRRSRSCGDEVCEGDVGEAVSATTVALGKGSGLRSRLGIVMGRACAPGFLSSHDSVGMLRLCKAAATGRCTGVSAEAVRTVLGITDDGRRDVERRDIEKIDDMPDVRRCALASAATLTVVLDVGVYATNDDLLAEIGVPRCSASSSSASGKGGKPSGTPTQR